MGESYKAILWNRQKRRYDRIMVGLMALYLLGFALINALFFPEVTPQTLIIRATGSLAFIMLHVILMIGPLARIHEAFIPLLYNRRHLGVSMFLIALIHGVVNVIQFHTLGDLNPILSIFVNNTHYDSLARFPFQSLGFFALVILFLMAATSHDFWLHNLSPKVWKGLHMLVYVAYALILMHVMLGVVQLEYSIVNVVIMGIGMVSVIGLHVVAGMRQGKKDQPLKTGALDGYFPLCKLDEIPDRRAKVAIIEGENIAVFRYGDKLSAVNNVCKHQNGPLGEGKIVDSCIVCPWHGYEYQPADGCSPPPFTEKVSTYSLKLIDGTVYVNPKANAEGTYVEPVEVLSSGF